MKGSDIGGIIAIVGAAFVTFSCLNGNRGLRLGAALWAVGIITLLIFS